MGPVARGRLSGLVIIWWKTTGRTLWLEDKRTYHLWCCCWAPAINRIGSAPLSRALTYFFTLVRHQRLQRLTIADDGRSAWVTPDSIDVGLNNGKQTAVDSGGGRHLVTAVGWFIVDRPQHIQTSRILYPLTPWVTPWVYRVECKRSVRFQLYAREVDVDFNCLSGNIEQDVSRVLNKTVSHTIWSFNAGLRMWDTARKKRLKSVPSFSPFRPWLKTHLSWGRDHEATQWRWITSAEYTRDLGRWWIMMQRMEKTICVWGLGVIGVRVHHFCGWLTPWHLVIIIQDKETS